MRHYTLPDETKRCPQCGESFGPGPNDWAARWAKRQFCSAACGTRARGGARRYLTERACQHCGQPFQPREARSIYCSHRCYGDSKIGRVTPPARGERRTLTCAVCGTAFTRIAHNLRRRPAGRFCSRACWKRHGPTNPKRFNPAYDTPAWRRVSRSVWERDGQACRQCGRELTRRQSACHHIRARDQFATVEAADQPANLITLCRPCHYRAHFG